MSADAPTPLDLDAIRKMYAPRAGSLSNSLYRVVCALADEVERLRAELDQAAPHITYDKGHLDGAHAARPARAWGEEAVVAPIAATLAAHPWSAMLGGCAPRSGCDWHGGDTEDEQDRHAAHVAGLVAAVVREHLPVKPDREAVRRAQHRALVPQVMSIFAAVGGTQADYDALLDTLADAVLDLWPGRSEAEVKAEALREAADEVERIDPEWDSALWIADPTSERGGAYHPVETWLRERADRLAAEGGDDRG